MTASRAARLHSVVLDCPDPRALGSFYARLLGWTLTDEGERWVTVANPDGGAHVEFQLDANYRPPTWPNAERPQMLHLDVEVEDLDIAHERALALGARSLTEVKGTQESPWRVYTDPAGHPFCLVTG